MKFEFYYQYYYVFLMNRIDETIPNLEYGYRTKRHIEKDGFSELRVRNRC